MPGWDLTLPGVWEAAEFRRIAERQIARVKRDHGVDIELTETRSFVHPRSGPVSVATYREIGRDDDSGLPLVPIDQRGFV